MAHVSAMRVMNYLLQGTAGNAANTRLDLKILNNVDGSSGV